MFVALLAFSAGALAPPPDDDDKAQVTVPTAAVAKHDDDPDVAQKSKTRPPGSTDESDDSAKSNEPPKPAQPDSDDDEEGKVQPQTAVVVTARRLDAARTQIDAGLGSTVYTLNNDTIEDRPGGETGSIASILKQSPGVSSSGEGLNIRGSKDIQVRINNVIIPEAISDPADHLSARLAQSTRVMTGTLPAQFGFVPAGVISVTTKNGLYQHGGEVEGYGGSDGDYEPAFEWAGSALATSLFGSVSVEGDRTRVADVAGNPTRDKRREIGGLAFADHILGPNDRLSFIVGGEDERHRFGQTSLPAGVQETSDAYAVGTYQHTAGGMTVQASLFAGSGTSDASFAQRTREHRSTFGTQVDGSYNLGMAHTFRLGLLASHSRADEIKLDRSGFADSRDALGLYLQDEWKLSSALTFNPGVRLDWLRGLASSAAVEPRASMVWAITPDLTAHIGYSRFASAAPLGDDQGGGSLPDERDDYYDAGLQYRVGVVTFGADAYMRKVRNLIDERQTIGSAVSEAFAYRQARFRGFELSATYSTHPLSAWFNLAVSRAQGRSIIDDANLFSPVTLGAAAERWLPISSDRPVTASGGMTWRSGKLAFSGMMDAASGAVSSPALDNPNGGREPAYASFSLSAVYHAGSRNSRRDIRLDLTNLTNVHYLTNDASSIGGGWTRRGRGRAIMIGVEQGF